MIRGCRFLLVYRTILMAAAAYPTATFAQAAQASMTGVVRDASGDVVPGVTVEVSSPALIERTRTGVTDGRSFYRIIDLPGGTYTVSFTTLPIARDWMSLATLIPGMRVTGLGGGTDMGGLNLGEIVTTEQMEGAAPQVGSRGFGDDVPQVLRRADRAMVRIGSFSPTFPTHWRCKSSRRAARLCRGRRRSSTSSHAPAATNSKGPSANLSTYLQRTQIIPGRFAKFSVQFDF